MVNKKANMENDQMVDKRTRFVVTMDPEHSKEEVDRKLKSYFKLTKLGIEVLIFGLSVAGAILIAYTEPSGFIIWLFSNVISIGYFGFNKQYPLMAQQMVFLVPTTLGIYNGYFMEPFVPQCPTCPAKPAWYPDNILT